MKLDTNPSYVPRGQHVLEQACTLLCDAKIAHMRGAYLTGSDVTVSVDARPDTGPGKTLSVLVSCIPAAHQAVDWRRLPVFLLRDSKSGPVAAVLELDRLGRAVKTKLAPGEFHVVASPTFCAGSVAIPQMGREPWSRSFLSSDKRVMVELSHLPGRDPQVTARPRDGFTNGGTVYFALMETKGGRIEREGRVSFAKTVSAPAIYDIAASDAQEVEMFFCVVAN